VASSHPDRGANSGPFAKQEKVLTTTPADRSLLGLQLSAGTQCVYVGKFGGFPPQRHIIHQLPSTSGTIVAPKPI
jgi:hypothetical protein